MNTISSNTDPSQVVTTNTTNNASQTEVESASTSNDASETWQAPKTSKEIVDAHKAAVTAQQDTVSISDRAEKIRLLNDEFFPHGPKSVTITQAFINRLNEYGFLSDQQAFQLNPSTESTSGKYNTLSEISGFIDEFKGKLVSEDSEHSLIDTLDQAQKVIDNFNQISSHDLPDDISSIQFKINEYLLSEESNGISEDERTNLEEVSAALRVADKLGIGTENKNNYAALYDQMK